jgi:uncharacterized protein YjbJ (UPF0337 family)
LLFKEVGGTRFSTTGFNVSANLYDRRLAGPVNTTNLRLINENLCVMTNLQFKGNWNEVKGKLKQKYGQLTDDDLAFAEGKEDELLGRLQKRLGRSKEELRMEIESM